ncbi:MAG: AAA family ATPase [Deltaproteobacteria bacterium]|nr:AAA family ATPase [Deltaproteobacteria bacterium]
MECLQNLEIAIRLRRGLNVVIGDVGTGKTTLCRRLIGKLEGDENVKYHLLLDSYFGDAVEFLSTVGRIFGLEEKERNSAREWQLKEDIKNYLFEQGVDAQHIVVLIIDEGQKIPDFCLEILREFLNYETNEHKLLQIVIFAQSEIRKTLETHGNFTDRINFLYDLGPLNFKDTRLMIRYRMKKASKTGKNPLRFTYAAMLAIYRATGGYPRKIVTLCHQIVMAVIVQNKTKVGWSLVRSCVHREAVYKSRVAKWTRLTVLSGVLVVLFVFALETGQFGKLFNRESVPLLKESQLKGEEIPVPPVKQDVKMYVKEEIKPAVVSAPASVRYPSILGKSAVRKGDILSKMIAAVYGFYNPENLRLVREANPHIRNMNRISVGDEIIFPATPGKWNPPITGVFVRIAEMDDLDVARRFFNENSSETLPLRMLSFWNDRGGLKFSILLEEDFTDQEPALKAIDRLPPHLSPDAEIISDWGENTVFFRVARENKKD